LQEAAVVVQLLLETEHLQVVAVVPVDFVQLLQQLAVVVH
jgi:hypothetical protein